METAEATTIGGIPTTEASGKPVYIVHKNKHGVEFKVINFENPDVCPNQGIVEYSAFKNKDFERIRDTNFSFPVSRDKASDIYYGIFVGFYESGDPRWQHFPLGMMNVYDRSIAAQAKHALILSKSPLVEGSPNAVQMLVKFRLIDKEKAAHETIKKIKDSGRALAVAEGLYGDELINTARNLGISVDNISPVMIQSQVMVRAQENPSEFLKIWEDPNRETITILKRALATKIVEESTDKGFTYNGSVLGHNFDFAVQYLITNREVAAIVDAKSKERLIQGMKAMQKPSMQTETDKVNENDALLKRLQILETQNAELLAKSKDVPTNSNPTSPLDEELTDLLKQGADKKLKGLHNYKATPDSIEKLKKRIAEAK